MQNDQVACFWLRQFTRLKHFRIIPGKDIATLTERTRDYYRHIVTIINTRQRNAMIRTIHRRPHQIDKSRVDHRKGHTRPFFVGLG